MNAFLTAAAGMGALLGGFFGHHATGTPPVRNSAAHVITASDGSVDISCVAAAVAAREASLDSAMTAETSAINNTYTARASALASAYSGSDVATIRASVKAAWSNFSTDAQTARKAWKTAQLAAWTQFRTAVKACGEGAVDVSDSANASLDAGSGD